MAGIDSWIEKQLASGKPKRAIKKALAAKGYSEEILEDVDALGTPEEKNLESTLVRRRMAEALAIIITASALAIGALYSYDTFRTPSDNEILLELSKSYGHVTIMKVTGNSMEPTLKDGETVFVAANITVENITQGDIGAIRFRMANQTVVKRFYALPNQTVAISGTAIKGTLLEKQLAYYNYVVPAGTIIVLGDNPEASVDSRHYGLVPISYVEGKVIRQEAQ